MASASHRANKSKNYKVSLPPHPPFYVDLGQGVAKLDRYQTAMDSWSAHAWLWEGPLDPNPGLHGKPYSVIPQNSLCPGLRHFRQRQLADGVPPCALALGKFEVADPRGIRLQRKSGWWWKWCVSGKGWEQREDGPEGQAKPGVCAGHCSNGPGWGQGSE